MTIFRQKREINYSVVSNQILEDTRMSFKARGLLIYMLSKPDNWQFYSEELVKHSDKDGISSIKTALNELEACGYLKRIQKRAEKGKFSGQDWILNDSPADSPQAGFPPADKPSTEKPLAENQQLLSTDGTKYLSNQLLNKDINVPDKSVTSSDGHKVKKSNSKKTRIYAQTDSNYKIAKYLTDKIKENNPNFKQSERTLQHWANDARLMVEKDHRSKQDIKKVIDFAQNNSFWLSNILSVDKLRTKFDQLFMQLQQSGKKNNRPVYQKEQLPDWAKKNSAEERKPTEEPTDPNKKAALNAEIKRRLAEIKADKVGGSNAANS